MTNENRIILKANRNLYQDQVIWIKTISLKVERSESEILRAIIDYFESQVKSKNVDLEEILDSKGT